MHGGPQVPLYYSVAPCTNTGLSHRYEGPAPSNFLHVSSREAFTQAISADRLTVVDFFVPWCVACRRFHPALVKLAAKHPDCTFLAVRPLATCGISPEIMFLAQSFTEHEHQAS